MDCGDQGRYANAKNLLSQHARFLPDKEEAETIVQTMQQQIAGTWLSTLRACGVSETDAHLLRAAFNYPGFSL